ncbi:unnamed protein product [Ectocarpus sp. CCAP 1310/34]|nr:unnamed protein product [Ectocarpus sp. CCAP 1310/34]
MVMFVRSCTGGGGGCTGFDRKPGDAVADFQKRLEGAVPQLGNKTQLGKAKDMEQNKGGMWAKLAAAKAGDPRLAPPKNTYLKASTKNAESRGDRQKPTRPCPTNPPDIQVGQSHAYGRFTPKTLTRGKGVSRVFGATLADVPLFQSTSTGVRPQKGHCFPFPHEDLHNPRGIDDEDNVLREEAEKDYYMLPDNSVANRITKFHNFCKEMPDVMCNYCSITLYPEDLKWVAIEPPGEGALPAACRASAANAHVPGIEGYTARSSRVKDGRQQYAFCSNHASEEGRQEWVFDDVGPVPDVIACLTPPERRATALLRMRCCMFKGGGGVGSGYTILKGAAEYVPADFDGSVGQIAIDSSKTKDIRPEKVNAAVTWLVDNNPLVAKYLTVWDTHKDKLSQPSQKIEDSTIPAGFPTIQCPAGRAGDTPSDIQGPSPDERGEVLRALPVYYDPYTGLAKDREHCMEMLRSVHLFPFGKGGYMRGSHGPQELPAMDHARYVKMRLTQVDKRFRDPSDTYTFAAVDDKTKQQLHRANTRSTTYSNIADAGEGFMQRLDEATRAEREVEDNDAVARVCQKHDIPLHSGKDCAQCSSAARKSSGVQACQRCRHFLSDGLLQCPHCHGPPTKQTRAGEEGKLPMLEGLEKVTQSLPSQIPGGSSYWASRLNELLAMVDSKDVGRPDLFITKTCHEGSDDMKALLNFYGCPHASWPRHQVEITRHWRRNIMEWLNRFVKGNDSVFGNVKDSWFRFEEQGRGSLHVHLLLWVADPVTPDTGPSQSQEPPPSQQTVDENGDTILRCVTTVTFPCISYVNIGFPLHS